MELKDSRYSLFSHFCSGEPMLYTYTILGEIYLWYACCCCTCELVLNVAGIHMNCLPSSMIFLIDYLDLSRLPSSIPSGNMAVENPRTKWSLNGGLKLGKSWKIIHTWNTFHCHLWCPEGSNTICKPSSQEAHHAVFCSVQYPHYISSPLSHPIPMSKSTWCLVHYGSTKLIYLYTYSESLQRFWGNMQKSSGWLEFHQLQWRWFGQGSENTSLYGDVGKWKIANPWYAQKSWFLSICSSVHSALCGHKPNLYADQTTMLEKINMVKTTFFLPKWWSTTGSFLVPDLGRNSK